MVKIKTKVVSEASHTIFTVDYDYILELNIDDILEVIDMETHWIYQEIIHGATVEILIESHILIPYYGEDSQKTGLRIAVPKDKEENKKTQRKANDNIFATLFE